MADTNNAQLPDGGEEMCITDAQYKGMLLDQQRVWQEVLELMEEEAYAIATEKIEQELAVINEKLKF